MFQIYILKTVSAFESSPADAWLQFHLKHYHSEYSKNSTYSFTSASEILFYVRM